MRRAVIFSVGVLVVLTLVGWQQVRLGDLERRLDEAEQGDNGADLEWELYTLEGDIDDMREQVERVDLHEHAINQLISDLRTLDEKVDEVETYAMSAEEMAYRLARIVGAG